MKKRILSFLMVLSMLVCSLASCGGTDSNSTASTTDETTSSRKALYLTLYAITNESTTDEAVKAVETQLNRLTESRYKTTLQLRYYTEDKYQEALDSMYAEFDKQKAEEEAKAAEEAAEAAKKKEEEKNMSAEELRKKRQEERLAAKEAEKKAKEEAEAEQEAIENGEDVAPDPITGPQMDIVFINGYEAYKTMVDNDLLVAMDEYLTLSNKLIGDYIPSTLLSAAQINTKTYGIPTNQAVGVSDYFVFRKDIVDKYNFNIKSVKTLYNCEDMLATVKKNEPGIVPMLAPVTCSGIDFYTGEEGYPIAVTNNEFSYFSAEKAFNLFNIFTVNSHFERMANFRANGYFAADPENCDNWFLAIKTGSLKDVQQWESEGYVATLYRKSIATAPQVCTALYGISSYTKYPDRCMEIIQMMYTDANFRNLFMYGIENENYVVDENGMTAHMLNDTYSMDFYKTGNTFIGYLPEGTPLTYVEDAKEANQGIKTSGFAGFTPTFSEDQAKLLEEFAAAASGYYTKLCSGVPDWKEQLAEVQGKLAALGFDQFLEDSFNVQYEPIAKDLSDTAKALQGSSLSDYVEIEDDGAPAHEE